MLERPSYIIFNMFLRRYYLLCSVSVFMFLPSSLGMRCETRQKYLVALIDQTVMSCPPSYSIENKDDKYCCSRRDGSMYCCDAKEFLEENGFPTFLDECTSASTRPECVPKSIGFVIPLLISVFVALMIVCCMCCLCCPCCIWYKRRNRGTVYNNIPPVSMTTQQPPVPQHGPHSDVFQQQPPPYPIMQMPQPMPHGSVYPPVPPHGIPMAQQYPPSPYPPAVPPHGQQQPPPYSEVTGDKMYPRQAPFNPNY